MAPGWPQLRSGLPFGPRSQASLQKAQALSHRVHKTVLYISVSFAVSYTGLLSSCLFNFYAEYIMRNAGLEEAQAGIKIARRNINLRYADDTTLMAESEEELKSLLMKVKEE